MKFHKQKLWLHRATMKRYEQMLQAKGFETLYLDYDPKPDSLKLHLKKISHSLASSPRKIVVAEPTDFMLEKRLQRFSRELKLDCHIVPSPGFINQPHENQEYRPGKKRWFMADFYKFQRKRLDILMDGDQPEGGKWSFDEDNRKKVPKKLLGSIPSLLQLKHDEIDQEAKKHVQKKFANHPGEIETLYYSTSHADAKKLSLIHI